MGRRYEWVDFEPEPEATGDESGDPDKYILTIVESRGFNFHDDYEEFAIIVHRTVEGKYPIDGTVADLKRRRAEHIVAALNDAAK